MDSDLLGARLRDAREAKRLSLRALATAVGVSPSLLSQVETGKTRPSVSTLYALVTELEISTDSLLGMPGPDQSPPVRGFEPAKTTSPLRTTRFVLQRGAANPVLEMENGVRWERLAVIREDDTEALLVTYQPGASSSIDGKLMRHLGIEHVYMLDGELSLQLEFDTHELSAGDSMVFDSQRPHMFSNRSESTATGIWHIIGQSAVAQAARDTDLAASRPTNAVDVLRAFRA